MSSSSSSMGALAAATAMALSGSLVLFSLRRFAKPSLDDDAHASDDPASLRPCLSSPSDKRPRGGKLRRKGEKRVRFAEGVVDNEGALPAARSSSTSPPAPAAAEPTCRGSVTGSDHRMPANREALYRGMLRDRSVHRTAYSY
ncbi:hypothetical protein D1007_17144 [Hordeum vulgare]|uniref:Uncharacterized protein n=1 Tax=Hordeum vulgare subsp. vulgare TaxID=112509 RepID=A0A8I6Y415_HORVV|nr:uncharacterized protein LOC123402657 [Hordeum vulgare subsp. vulgare]KAE8806621.1 hypothetical protein D1007_17144 [Hordeum vulgare]KAI4983772.1 hypothetical protein ZWY2020_025638 [Hordeum vulgare]